MPLSRQRSSIVDSEQSEISVQITFQKDKRLIKNDYISLILFYIH